MTDDHRERPGRRLVELSHVIREGMITCPGLPGPEIGSHLTFEQSRSRYAAGTEFHISWMSLVGNTGTYVDTPAHRYEGAADLTGLPLERLVDLEGLVVQLPKGVREVTPRLLEPYEVTGRAALIHSGWDAHWGTEAYGAGGHPFVTEDGAAWLAEQGPALVGIDSVNIDDMSGGTRPAHSTLLAAGIPIVESLCGLEALPPEGFRFHAAPPLVEGGVAFPVRAYAIVDGDS